MQTVQVRVKPKQTVQVKVKPCVKLAALQTPATAQQGKTQWVQKVTAKPGTVFGGMVNIKVNPNLVNKICAVKLGDYAPTFEELGEYFETPKNEDAFPIYFIALADQKIVDFETEVE